MISSLLYWIRSRFAGPPVFGDPYEINFIVHCPTKEDATRLFDQLSDVAFLTHQGSGSCDLLKEEE